MALSAPQGAMLANRILIGNTSVAASGLASGVPYDKERCGGRVNRTACLDRTTLEWDAMAMFAASPVARSFHKER